MKYLLNKYGETPVKCFDLPKTNYSYELSLNLLQSTNKPIIDYLDEGVGSNKEKISLKTESMTLISNEGSDPDNDIEFLSIHNSLLTMTMTKVELEATDTD